ncbi:hypothetical protein M514_10527 [Trichuris suis]|uniref:Uncharacterized protein n=1 Tax=Trichuris suis TaxID=68888 RepID=A0A085N3D8_9BILA|nr:hypothetical protein M513_10527 [Trichuris suis]KFD63984.1 hypothetical protein M514_10527 [Trichuris suis]
MGDTTVSQTVREVKKILAADRTPEVPLGLEQDELTEALWFLIPTFPLRYEKEFIRPYDSRSSVLKTTTTPSSAGTFLYTPCPPCQHHMMSIFASDRVRQAPRVTRLYNNTPQEDHHFNYRSATAQSNGRRSDLSQHGGTQPDTKLSSPGRIMTLESSAESTEASGINQALPGDVSMRGTVLDDYINQFD